MTRGALVRLVAVLLASCSAEPAARSGASAPNEPRDRTPSTDAAESAEPLSSNESKGDPRPSSNQPGSAATSASVQETRLMTLTVPEFLDAVVAVPGGAARLPVVIATHGAGGDPEWTCNEWGRRVGGRAVVLCPRGKAISARDPWGFFYPDHLALEKEVLAAVAALQAALPNHVDAGPMMYTGYSQGATMGALFIPTHASRFPYLVLTEGGFESWSQSAANKFAKNGGKRVLFVCGGSGCTSRAKKSAGMLEKAGVATRVEHVEGGGHTDGGRVGRRLDEVYRWVLEG